MSLGKDSNFNRHRNSLVFHAETPDFIKKYSQALNIHRELDGDFDSNKDLDDERPQLFVPENSKVSKSELSQYLSTTDSVIPEEDLQKVDLSSSEPKKKSSIIEVGSSKRLTKRDAMEKKVAAAKLKTEGSKVTKEKGNEPKKKNKT
ncbi:hypothetical protein HK096_011444, partial [Nowakowskiella sp. JEL0078]